MVCHGPRVFDPQADELGELSALNLWVSCRAAEDIDLDLIRVVVARQSERSLFEAKRQSRVPFGDDHPAGDLEQCA